MDATYRERLLPKAWVWLVGFAFAAMLGVAYGAALGASAGWIVGGAGVLLVAWLLWITAPRIVVDGQGITVAGARLPTGAMGAARVVDSSELRDRAGPTSDARLFIALRPWSASSAVMVDVDDPEDPHPAWLFSSRHPARAVAAIAATM